MCKKAVEGLDALCLEVTFGKAALIKTRQQADRLAKLMVRQRMHLPAIESFLCMRNVIVRPAVYCGIVA